MKNKAILILALLVGANCLLAQSYIKKAIPSPVGKIIVMNFDYADVEIKTWDKNEIEIKGSVEINEGENDENFIITIEEEGSQITVNTYVKDKDQLPQVTVIKQPGKKTIIKNIPKGGNWRDFAGEYHNASIWTQGIPVDINLEIYVPKSSKLAIKSLFGDVTIENSSGQLEAENTHGRLDAIFNQASITQPVSLKSKHNIVDVSLSASAKLDVLLESKHGKIFSDMEIDRSVNHEGMRSLSPKEIKGTLNGGGVLLKLESTHNKIYLRKAKSQ